MHDIIIEIREKACVHVHHLEIITHKSGNGNHRQLLYREYMKGEEGVWANGMKRSQIKWKLLLFDESDFFSFEAVYFYFLFSFNRAMLFILSQIKKRVFLKKTNQIIKLSGLKRMYNLCIVKKAKYEISGSHR